MFSFLFGGLGDLISNLLWIIMVLAIVMALLFALLNRFTPKWALQFKAYYGIGTLVSAGVAFIIGCLKIGAFISYILTAQQKIDKLEGEKAGLEQKVKEKEQEISRKQKQYDDIKNADQQADIKYVPVYRTIEKLREVPDLSVANQLANSLTSDYYKMDEVPNAPVTPAN